MGLALGGAAGARLCHQIGIQEIRNLSQQQWSQIAIAQAVGVSVRTV